MKKILAILCLVMFAAFNYGGPVLAAPPTVENPQNGSIGVQGTIASAPPATAATIATPSNNQTFTILPVKVSGLCTSDLLVKIFKNNVFGGSTICKNGSYSIEIDLFSGSNDIIARVFDDLDQPGPDSNVVTVIFNDNVSVDIGPRVSITSNYAKRGANPGATLGWPVAVTGGVGPYAISVDWGDGKNDLYSRDFPGELIPEHSYEAAGVYNVVIKVTDKNGVSAFLHVVAIANGIPGTDANGKSVPGSQPLNGNSSTSSSSKSTEVKFVLWPFYILVPFIVGTFWLGKRHAIYILRKKLQSGDRPFN